jgi:protease-4
MGGLSVIWRVIRTWYFSVLVLVVLGLTLGSTVFFYVFPGKPKIGIIDLPFTVISSNSSFVIGAFLDYARENDDIKAVVVKLNSPGGGAASSEKLFLEMRELREVKPVVVVTETIAASGGYMMLLGANKVYVKPTSLVGSVGVILSFPGPMIPSPPNEQVITSGPYKAGDTRRHWIRLADQVKEGFGQMVVTERGDKLKMTREELLNARLYSGIEAVRLGLVDELGSDTDAIQTAADLANISGYELVDVNTEVFRIFVQKSQRIFGSATDGGPLHQDASLRALVTSAKDDQGLIGPLDERSNLDSFRRPFLPSGVIELEAESPPGFPLNVNTPRIYYLYVGPPE